MTPNREPKFCSTSVTNRIMTTLATAQKANLIASIQGPPGIGKTTAVLRYAQERPGMVWYYAARQDTAAKSAFFCDLAIRINGFKDLHTRGNVAALMEAAANRASSFGVPLLIVDEAQVLKSDTFETIRAIHDEGTLALAFVGNHSFADRHNIERVALTVSPQFRSRIDLIDDLGAAESDDAAAVARAHGVPPPLIGRLVKIAGGPRGLRVIEHVARLAVQSADGAAPTRAHFEDAITVLCS